MEDLVDNQPVTQDRDVPEIIAFSPSGKMAALKSRQSAHTELRDTTTWELVGPSDIEYKPEVAFSADDDRIAVFTESLVTIRCKSPKESPLIRSLAQRKKDPH